MKKLFFFILGLGLLFFHPTSAADIFNFSNASSDVKIQGTETNDYGVVFYLGHPNFTTTSAQVFLELHPVLSSCSDCKLGLYVFDDPAYSSNTDSSVIHSFTGDETTTIKVWADTTLNFDVTKYYALSFYHSLGTPVNDIIKGTAGGSYSGGTWWGAGVSRYSGDPFFCIGEDNSTGTEPIANCGVAGPSTPLASQLTLIQPSQATSVPAWNKFIFLAQASTTANYKITLRYWNTTTSYPTVSEKVFSNFAYDQNGTIGWTSFVSVPWASSFLPDESSTYFWNATLFERITSTQMGIGFWDPIAYTTGSVMYDPTAYVPGTTEHFGIGPSSTEMGGETITYGQNNISSPQVRTDMARLFEVDCSAYSGSIWSSTTIDGIGCNIKKVFYSVGAVLFIPGQIFDTPTMLAASFDGLKATFPFSIFFSTVEDIKTILAQGNTNTTLAIRVPMPGGSVTSTDIVIASPTFARDQVGEHIWGAYTNLFILGLGVMSISGIVAWVFFL